MNTNLFFYLLAAASLTIVLGCNGLTTESPGPQASADPDQVRQVGEPAGENTKTSPDRASQSAEKQPAEDNENQAGGKSSADGAPSTDAPPDDEATDENGSQIDQPANQQDEPAAAPADVAENELAQASPAPRRRTGNSNGIEKISFEDINLQLRQGIKFRPFMLTDRARELNGQKVRIVGVIFASENEIDDKFVLLRNSECLFGDDGLADHVLNVILREGVTTSYTNKFISVDGVLKLNPFGLGDITWCVFDLEDAHNIRVVPR